jgi:WD40 repeat protein
MFAVSLLVALSGVTLVSSNEISRQNVTSICFLRSSDRVASVDNQGRLQILSVPSGKLIQEARAPVPLRAIAYSSRDDKIAVGDTNNQVFLWKAFPLNMIWKTSLPWGAINGLAFSPDGKTIACATSPNELIRFLDVSRGKPMGVLSYPGNGATAVAYVSEGRRLVCAGQKLIVWNTSRIPIEKVARKANPHFSDAGKTALVYDGILGWTTAIAVYPHRNWIVAAGVACPKDGEEPLSVVIVDISLGTVIRTIGRNNCAIESVSVSPNGDLVAAGDSNGKILLWSIPQKQSISAPSTDLHSIHCLTFSPDGRILVVAGDGGVRFFAMDRKNETLSQVQQRH